MELNGHNDYIDWLIEWVWSVGGCGLLPGERKRCTSHRKPFRWLPHAPAGREGRERERGREGGRGGGREREGEGEGGRERGREGGRGGGRGGEGGRERERGKEGERWYMYVLYNIFNTSRTTFFNFTNYFGQIVYKYEEQLWVVQRMMSNTQPL